MKDKKEDLSEEGYGHIDFGYECDLHHFHPSETKGVIIEFIKQAKERGYRHIRLVHGKGHSVKKMQAHKILEEHPDVQEYGNDGANWGATIITLIKH